MTHSTLTTRWGSREGSMYFILLTEFLATTFMREKSGHLAAQTMKSMFPGEDTNLENNLCYMFQTAVITAALFCQPIRKLAVDPIVGGKDFEKACSDFLEKIDAVLDDAYIHKYTLQTYT